VLYIAVVSSSPAWPDILTIAEDQWGLITTAQADQAGMAWTTVARMVRGGTLARVAHGVYRVRGSGEPEHLELRAAWLQLAPDTPAWERQPDAGVVSHRSAAALYGLGELPADAHEFTLPHRRQSRRADVRLHRGHVGADDWTWHHGLPVTRPGRIAVDLLAAREDPGAIGQVIADALRSAYDDPGSVAATIAPYAASLGLRRGDGMGLMSRLVDLTGAPELETWLRESNASAARPDVTR
jgi:predicted transcriptional regulator of viral defense system